MSRNPSDPLIKSGWLIDVAEEQAVGDRFEGESQRERMLGKSRMVVVDIFKRSRGPEAGTFFMRVALKSMIATRYIYRYNHDIDRYAPQRELCALGFIAGAALAERDNEQRAAKWDTIQVGEEAIREVKEALREIDRQK